MREFDPQPLELGEDLRRLNFLGDGRYTQRAADVADGLDHAAIHRVGRDAADELAVDLEKIDR